MWLSSAHMKFTNIVLGDTWKTRAILYLFTCKDKKEVLNIEYTVFYSCKQGKYGCQLHTYCKVADIWFFMVSGCFIFE